MIHAAFIFTDHWIPSAPLRSVLWTLLVYTLCHIHKYKDLTVDQKRTVVCTNSVYIVTVYLSGLGRMVLLEWLLNLHVS